MAEGVTRWVVVKGKLHLCSATGLVAALGLLILLVGMAMSILGVTGTVTTLPQRPGGAGLTAATPQYFSEHYRKNQRAGRKMEEVPVLGQDEGGRARSSWGVGIFLFICANAVLHEERDKKTKVINLETSTPRRGGCLMGPPSSPGGCLLGPPLGPYPAQEAVCWGPQLGPSPAQEAVCWGSPLGLHPAEEAVCWGPNWALHPDQEACLLGPPPSQEAVAGASTQPGGCLLGPPLGPPPSTRRLSDGASPTRSIQRVSPITKRSSRIIEGKLLKTIMPSHRPDRWAPMNCRSASHADAPTLMDCVQHSQVPRVIRDIPRSIMLRGRRTLTSRQTQAGTAQEEGHSGPYIKWRSSIKIQKTSVAIHRNRKVEGSHLSLR
ncbi:unnamed protein product [Boreogadus saida]